ncbi:MAG: PQQ-like beta-propeller repeat protein [candidate division WOR-3 bacterium]|nr:MAG: PQQ-like beta-propeller repeat protein [candidate division WOR-3 bacterium]
MSRLTRILVCAVLSGSCVYLGCDTNQRPETPAVPFGPGSGAPRDSVELSTIGYDPEGLKVSCRFSWGDGDTSEWSGWFEGGDTISLGHAWSVADIYEVRAQCRDPHEAFSEWSDFTLFLVGHPPRQPTLQHWPALGKVDTTYTVTVVTTDLDHDGIRYVFDWGDGVLDTTPEHPSGQPANEQHAWSVPDSYILKVQAVDATGLASGWSDPAVVRISDPYGPGTLLWSYGTGGDVRSSPAIGPDGVVYVGSLDSCLHAVNPDGTEKWRFKTAGFVVSTPALADDGTVYFGSLDGKVYAVSPDGTKRWEFATGGEVVSSPAIGEDGRVYVGSEDSCLHALKPDGTLDWSFRTGGWVVASPVVDEGGNVYFGSHDSTFYCLKPDGGLEWSYETGGQVQGSAALVAGAAYFTSFDGYIHALNPEGGLLWKHDVGDLMLSSPAVGWNGLVYVGSDQGPFYCFYPGGDVKWSFDTGGPISSSPALTLDRAVYFGSGTDLWAMVSESGGVLWRYSTESWVLSSPAIDTDGTVYVGSDDQSLYAIRGAGSLDDGPWPKYRHDLRNTGRASAGN